MIYEWLQHIRFVWPQNLLLLGLIPFLVRHYLKNQRKNQGAVLISGLGQALPSTIKTRMRHLPFILRMIAVVCLIMALARPQHQTQMTRTEGEGIDIVLCMDVSGSMAARDISPSRLAAAKNVAVEFVKNRPVDRIGLVIFSGEAFTKCPITPDKTTVINMIRSLDIRDGGYLAQGTLIGEGLATSVNRVSKGTARSKVVILLTDGKEEAPDTRIIDPLTALEIAKANRVKVYAIGMGGGAEVDGEQLAPGGGLVKDFIDEGLLKRIAGETGGKYYRATDQATLQMIYSQINSLEKSKVEIIHYTDTREMFITLVLAALGWLLLEVLLKYSVFRKFP